MNSIKQKTAELLEKEMDRRDFLKHVGIAAIAVAGLPAILNALNNFGSKQKTTSAPAAGGYGAMAYGGAAKK